MSEAYLVLALVGFSPAAAQDFGVEWLDRVTREIMQERGPLQEHPFEPHAGVGMSTYYDGNLFRRNEDVVGDIVLIPYGTARVKYAEETFDVSADLLVAYKEYIHERAESDNEERFYGRARYTEAWMSLDVAEIFRHESDPTDAIFSTRAERLVSNTLLRTAFDVDPNIAVEVGANLQIVRFLDLRDTISDNANLRTDVTGVYRTSDALDLLAQVGYTNIRYRRHVAPPDVLGMYVRGGVRGPLSDAVQMEALAGWTQGRSGPLPETGRPMKDSTGDAAIHLRGDLNDDTALWGSFARLITFGGGQDPYQVTNRFVGSLEYLPTEKVTLRGRVQYDTIHSALGVRRDYLSVGGTVEWRAYQNAVLEAGFTYGRASLENLPFDTNYSDPIVHVGLVFFESPR